MARGTTSDRISELPDPLMHHILSFIPIKDAARTSILSKRWNTIWATLPYLDFSRGFLGKFCTINIRRYEAKRMKKNKYLLKVADKIISSRRSQISSIEKLCLFILDHEISQGRLRLGKKIPSPLDFRIERLMSCVANRGLKELVLKVSVRSSRYFSLPSSILSAKSINVLNLSGFDLRSLSSLDIKFPSLGKLCLRCVCLEDEILGKLIKGCPLMEDLQLIGCEGVKTMYVMGLVKLKVLKVINVKGMEILEIQVPNLQVLTVTQPSPFCKVDPATCFSLIELHLSGKFMSEKWFHRLISDCHSLENLTIHPEEWEERITISIDTLKTLQLDLFLSPMEAEIEIHAPNLENFILKTTKLSTISLNASDKLEIGLEFYPGKNDLHDQWHDQLAYFLDHFNHFSTVKLTGCSDVIIIPKEQRDNLISPLKDTQNLIISVGIDIVEAAKLVEYMFWLSPRARTLTIKNIPLTSPLCSSKAHTILECYYEKNVPEDSSFPCCKSLPILCWRHCLREIRVVKFEGDDDEWREVKDFFLKFVNNLKIEDVSSSFDSFYDGLYSDYHTLFLDNVCYPEDEF